MKQADVLTETRKLSGIIERAKDVLDFPEILKHVRSAKKKMRGLNMAEIDGMPAIRGPKKSIDTFIHAMQGAGLHPKVYTDSKTKSPVVVVKATPW